MLGTCTFGGVWQRHAVSGASPSASDDLLYNPGQQVATDGRRFCSRVTSLSPVVPKFAYTHTHSPTHTHTHTHTHHKTHTYTHTHLHITNPPPHTHTLQNNIKLPQYKLKQTVQDSLRSRRGNLFSYFRTSRESFDKLLCGVECLKPACLSARDKHDWIRTADQMF